MAIAMDRENQQAAWPIETDHYEYEEPMGLTLNVNGKSLVL